MLNLKRIATCVTTFILCLNASFAQSVQPALKEYQQRTNLGIAKISEVIHKDAAPIFSADKGVSQAALVGFLGAMASRVEGGTKITTTRVKLNASLHVFVNKIKQGQFSVAGVIEQEQVVSAFNKLISDPAAKEEVQYLLFRQYHKETGLLNTMEKSNLEFLQHIQKRAPALTKEFEKINLETMRLVALEERALAAATHGVLKFRTQELAMIKANPVHEIVLSLEEYELRKNFLYCGSQIPVDNIHKMRLRELARSVRNYFDPITGEMTAEYYAIKGEIYKAIETQYGDILRFKNVEEEVVRVHKYRLKYASSNSAPYTTLRRLYRLEAENLPREVMAVRAKEIIREMGLSVSDRFYLPSSIKRFTLLAVVLVVGSALADGSAAQNARFYDNLALLDHASADVLQLAEQDAVLSSAYKTRADIINAVASAPEEDIKIISDMAYARHAKESRTLDFDQLKNKNTPNLKKYGFNLDKK